MNRAHQSLVFRLRLVVPKGSCTTERGVVDVLWRALRGVAEARGDDARGDRLLAPCLKDPFCLAVSDPPGASSMTSRGVIALPFGGFLPRGVDELFAALAVAFATSANQSEASEPREDRGAAGASSCSWDRAVASPRFLRALDPLSVLATFFSANVLARISASSLSISVLVLRAGGSGSTTT
jgi:hypothetical protein